MITNFISKSLEYIELLICEKSAGVISSGLCGFQAPLGTLVGGGPAAVNTRAVSMWVQPVPPSDGISAVDL